MAEIINRHMEIRFPNGDRETITGNNIIAESMSITRSICDGDFKLGGCIATQFDLQLIEISPDMVQGKKIQAVFIEYTDQVYNVLYPRDDLIPSDNLLPDGYLSYNSREYIIFTGYIDTAQRQKNRQIVNITAYDDLYKICNKNVSTWFFQFAEYSSNAHIMSLLDSLFTSQIGYDEEFYPERMQWISRWQSSGGNNNYSKSLSLSKSLVESIYKGDIMAVDILRSANELMGLFGYITNEGKYNTLSIVDKQPILIDRWIDLEFEEYTTSQIDIVSFTHNDSNHCTLGRASATNSCYYSDDNILTNCSTDYNTIKTLVNNITNAGRLSQASAYSYRPFKLTTIDKLLPDNFMLGKKVKISTGDSEIPYIESFVFQEKITGIQSLKYELSAEGDQILAGYDSLSEG